VTVRLRGRGASRTVAAHRAVTSSGSLLDLGEQVTVTKRVPMPAGGATFGLLALSHYSDAGVGIRAATCFRPDATSDCAATDFTTVGVNETSTVGSFALAWPGDLPASGAHGVFHADGVAVGARVLGFYLTFDAS
jgi:hypothetical protein